MSNHNFGPDLLWIFLVLNTRQTEICTPCLVRVSVRIYKNTCPNVALEFTKIEKDRKKRENMWLFDFRMTVYYQAHNSREINRHDLESKCPNIMKRTRTVA